MEVTTTTTTFDPTYVCGYCRDAVSVRKERYRPAECEHWFHEACLRTSLRYRRACPTCSARTTAIVPFEGERRLIPLGAACKRTSAKKRAAAAALANPDADTYLAWIVVLVAISIPCFCVCMWTYVRWRSIFIPTVATCVLVLLTAATPTAIRHFGAGCPRWCLLASSTWCAFGLSVFWIWYRHGGLPFWTAAPLVAAYVSMVVQTILSTL